jgi:hypothetical protein
VTSKSDVVKVEVLSMSLTLSTWMSLG